MRAGGAGPAALYALLLAYGTLYPLRDWTPPAENVLRLMLGNASKPTSWADLVTNLLLYIPFGFLLAHGFRRRVHSAWGRISLTLLVGAFLSLALETLQAFIPGRTPSALDLLLNTLGTCIGGLLAHFLAAEQTAGRWLRQLRAHYIHKGATADIGLMVIGLWAVSQLAPFVPSLDLANLKQGLRPFLDLLQGRTHFSWLAWGEYLFGSTALGLTFAGIQLYRAFAVSRFLTLAGTVLLLKIFMVGRQLAPESLLGLAAAGLLLGMLTRGQPPRRARLAFTGYLMAFILDAIQPGTAGTAQDGFNWIPFRAHVGNNIIGIIDLLAATWPTLGMAQACLLLRCTPRRALLIGTPLVLLGASILETMQLAVPGRSADITDILMALAGWLFPWWLIARHADSRQPPAGEPATRRARSTFLLAALAGITLPLALLLPGGPSSSNPKTLPDPASLPPVEYPAFRQRHPRLPAPTDEEIRRLRARNPQWLQARSNRARGGRGKLMDAIFMARIDPASQDLNRIFERLMATKMSWRGGDQGMLLATGYDWLHHLWSPQQRARLARRVVEASNYLIRYIREHALSPYNVYLYNSPLQALVATSLATWQDLPEADPPMRWTTFYLNQVVLPVWRQVMGRHGGWHEGGEYVGIGIGDAVYRIPAMWQRATGEDPFAAVPGIRGFLDFLVYRTRPDGTQMRWGDGAFFDRGIPDRAALAMKYGHTAAYSLHCPPGDLPSIHPWGPLTSDAFCDPSSLRRLPLQKWFDGIGMIIARSAWTPDATYVTFKAGDNYWSHVHLDQGAFTIFKKGPLAIDSGYYGPGYQSDHRFNYSAQTIAHNVITVKDPDDTVPMPPKKKRPARPIANDGGQRRVGSGWGQPAPMDLEDWMAQRETYHTGRIVRHHEGDALVAAVAELTPAYTNRRSGLGAFADRTFRVRYSWRTFIYDRLHDLVIVYDDVVAANPSFEKRSLVHTIERPILEPGGFRVRVPPNRSPDRPAGEMVVRVLLPEDARIRLVGGRDRAFWVDGRNHDEDGRVWARIAKRKKNRPEPGRWRAEILPGRPRAEDRFLMVLVPGKRDRLPRIMRTGSNEAPGVLVEDENGRLEAVFPHAREGVRIRLKTPAETREIDLTTPRAPLRDPPGILARIRARLSRME